MKHIQKRIFIIFVNVMIQIHSFPVGSSVGERDERNENSGASALIPFLKKFGYLESSGNTSQTSHESDSLYTQDSIEEAIREMQRYGALPQTGKLDNETLKLLSKPRCGLPDVIKEENLGKSRRKRFIIGSKGWNKRRITYRVENWAPQLTESAVLSEVRQAFKAWADYSRLRFVDIPRRNYNDDVDISISFGRGYHGDSYPFDGSGGVLAHAFFPGTHGVLGGDIHFDLDENWRLNSNNSSNSQTEHTQNTISFLAVAVHEIGHAIGLSHSPSQDSVMFPYYQNFDQGGEGSVRLGNDDIMAMYHLYISRQGYEDDGEDAYTTESVSDLPTSERQITPQSSTMHYETSTFSRVTESSTVIIETPSMSNTTDEEEKSTIPEICKDGFDTISFIRNELFVFKNEYMWRYRKQAFTEPGYPVKSSRLFPILENVKKVDAAFENEDSKIIFFSGKKYWVYEDSGSSTSSFITDFGLPDSVQKLDAVFIWGKNDKVYFFSDNLVWRYNASIAKMDEGYPKEIGRWRGIPETGIDSALKWLDGRTYFFKGDQFWRFDDSSVHTEDGFPLRTSLYWFGC